MEPTAAPERGKRTTPPRRRERPRADLRRAQARRQPPKPQKGKGKLGSLENPEVYDNVPGHWIPEIEREFDDFDTEAGSFLRGETPEEQFIGFRLKQGVYGQRQPDVQMIRVKLPMGGITPEQMEAFADVIEDYAPLNKGHITTRQNIQIHHIPLPDAAELIRRISDAGLSSREGCGNTVRNVTGDPFAGVTEGELFDITPYAGAYVRYFVRHPTTQLMPRKVKTAFTATDEDVAITGIHDIGFIPRVRDGVRGRRDPGRRRHLDHASRRPHPLRVRRARQRRLPEGLRGGLPAVRPPGVAARQPRPRPDQGPDRQDRDRRLPRDGRGGARGRLGRRARLLDRPPHVLRGRGGERARGPRRPRARTATARSSSASASRTSRRSARRASARSPSRSPAATSPRSSSAGSPQIMREFSGGYARTTVHQNFVLRWVRDESVYDVWQRLGELGLGDAGPGRDHRRRLLPRHRLLQARDHRLDGPQQGHPGAGRGDGASPIP